MPRYRVSLDVVTRRAVKAEFELDDPALVNSNIDGKGGEQAINDALDPDGELDPSLLPPHIKLISWSPDSSVATTAELDWWEEVLKP